MDGESGAHHPPGVLNVCAISSAPTPFGRLPEAVSRNAFGTGMRIESPRLACFTCTEIVMIY